MLLRDNGRACTFGEPCSTTDKHQHQERPQQTTKRCTSGDTTDPVASTAAIPPKQRHPPKPPRPMLPTPNHKRYLLKASRRHHKRYPLGAVNAIPPPHQGRQRHPPKAANARPPPPPHRSRQRSPLVATNPAPQPTNGRPKNAPKKRRNDGQLGPAAAATTMSAIARLRDNLLTQVLSSPRFVVDQRGRRQRWNRK